MSKSPYAPPLPYGEWVLSLTVLLGGFFWLRSIDTNPDGCARADDGTGEERGGENEKERSEAARSSGQTPASSAYQTDEEAEKARRAARRRADRCRFTESHPTTRDRMSPARRRRGLLGTQEGSEPSLDLEATGGVFRAAAMAASTAVRKSHFDHLDHAGRLRLEREAYRIRVHQHLQRELRKHSIEFSYDREEGPEWGR